MAAIDNLNAAMTQLSSRILEILSSPNPTVTLSDGTTVDKAGYLQVLNQEMAQLQKNIVILGGPYEIRSRGI